MELNHRAELPFHRATGLQESNPLLPFLLPVCLIMVPKVGFEPTT